MRSAGGAKDKHVQLAFRFVLARTPSATEEGICAWLVEQQMTRFAATKLSAADAEEKALAQLCHTLFNTSEFLYVE
jgi:hypothetical protein